MLVEQEVPLQKGILLAAEMTGNAALSRSAEAQIAALNAGETPRVSTRRGIPQYVLWLLGTAGSRDQLVRNLRGAADLFRRRGMRQIYALKYLLPASLTVIIGGGIALAYTLIVYQPVVFLMSEVTRQ